MNKKRSGILTTGAVLCIISGIFGILTGILSMAVGDVIAELVGLASIVSESYFMVLGIVWIILGLLAILGGGYALGRKNFLMALITGGVCSLLISPFYGLLGILSIILIAISKKEFQ